MDTTRRVIRCFLYARISKDREGAGLACERQIEDCEALAEALSTSTVEYRIVRVFQDNDISAYAGKPRPDYLTMLEALRNGEADCVLAWHTDRLHRSPAELEEYIDVCEPRRVDTRTVKAGHLDLTTATGRMIARQLGVHARYEVERMAERQRRSRDQMAAKGLHMGGRRPFGWEVDGMTVIPMEAEEIKNATAAILAGASLRSIVKDLNKRAIPTSTGNTWEASEIRRVLLRPRNAGILVHRGKEAGPGQWPAILDEGEWRSMCAILTDPDRRTTPGNERKYLGSNIYVCGKCGAKMRCSTTQKTPQGVTAPSYACRAFRHVLRRIKTVDDYVVLAILERVSRPDANALFVKRQDPVDVQGVQQDMRAARSTLDDLAKALGAGEMDMQEWRTASQAARRRLETAENLLSRAVQANPVLGLVNAEDPEAEWNRLDLSRRRAVLQHLMTVTVLPTGPGRKAGGGYFDPDALRIEWK